MLDVTPRDDVADCHLLELPDGFTVLIDAGKLGDSPNAALHQLQAHHVTSIDLVVISHFHIDHYGALDDIVDSGIKIGRIALVVPNPASAALEKSWGTSLEEVNRVLEKLRSRGIPYFTPEIGQRIVERRNSEGIPINLDVLSVNDGLHTPVGLTDVNGTCMVLRLSHGGTRVLFAGDLNLTMGDYIAKSRIDLSADILKASHHGTEGTVPDSFYDRVGAKAVLVSSPRHLWESARSMRTRNYYKERNIPTYVTGINGTVTVTLTDDGYTVESER